MNPTHTSATALDALTAPTTGRAWRWAVAGATVANVGLNYWANSPRAFNGQTNAVVSAKYSTLLTPAGYAFSIWGLIFLGLLLYAGWQLLPAQRQHSLPDAVARPLTLVNLLTASWSVVFAYELLPLSVVVMLLILAGLAVVYGRSRQFVQRQKAPTWVSVPFGLFLGWISVATVVNVTVWLGTRWQPGAEQSVQLAIVLVGVVAGLALNVTRRFRELAYPAAVAWGLLAIGAARRADADTLVLSWMAMAAAALVVVGAVVLVWWGRPQRTAGRGMDTQ